jgi:hypothetical protein
MRRETRIIVYEDSVPFYVKGFVEKTLATMGNRKAIKKNIEDGLNMARGMIILSPSGVVDPRLEVVIFPG